MPSNQTPNYQLSQWERSDKILMDDFNADNAKIDGALSAHDAALALKGNCRIWTTSYVGNGKCGESQPNILTLPWEAELVMVFNSRGFIFTMCRYARGAMLHAGAPSFGDTIWEGTTLKWHSNYPLNQMNEAGETYWVVAFG